jgi:hypothetical protein
MPLESLRALISAYETQIEWLLVQADEFESGLRKVFGTVGGKERDVTTAFVADYRHKAANMKAIIQAYERLHSQGR